MQTPKNPRRAMKKIVAVDDDIMSLEILEDIFRDKGIELVSFLNGSEAMAFLESTQQSIDLFLIDIRLKEQTGLDLLKYLKENRKEYSKSPVIMMSAISTKSYRDKAFALGAVEYISKPFEESDLNSILEEHLQSDYLIPVL